MSAGTVIAGALAFLLGVVGLLQLYGTSLIPVNLAVVSVYLTTIGAVVLFGSITMVGLILVIGGLATMGEDDTKVVVERVREPVVIPAGVATVYTGLSFLKLSVLGYLSQGKRVDEIVALTDTPRQVIEERIMELRAEGYLKKDNTLTEKGLEALRLADTRPVYVQPSP